MQRLTTPTTIQRGDLVVSSKVLGHISEGLYRGPAGVLKELVSNAFDANARTVWISTGRPTFDVVSVKDDGDGMTLDKFIELVSGGIGDSDKRSTNVQPINGRQMIGRLGIGLLGVSQISHEFEIVSHARSDHTAFRATIQMKDFRREILGQPTDRDPASEQSEQIRPLDFPVGGYEVEPIQFEPNNVGLTITATEPTAGFRRQFSDSELQPLPKEFHTFCRRCQAKDELATGPLYNRMIWQLASLSPISYMSDSTVSSGDPVMTDLVTRLQEFDFSVIVDGVKLFKPILLGGPTSEVNDSDTAEGEGPFHFPLSLDETVWGTKLKVRGYIYGSKGLALHPDDIRGVLIRLRHVGIGEYDKSFLGYRYSEGPRFAWLTGELFVEDGLEDGLTVGRDGFDAGHPHYIAMRLWLHQELRSRVFPTLYKGINARRLRRDAERSHLRTVAFHDSISRFAGMPIEIQHIADDLRPPVQVDLDRGVAALNDSAIWPRGKRQLEMAQRLSIVFELVRLVESDRSAVYEFVKLTRQLLSQG